MPIDNSKKYIKFLTSLIEHFKFQELTNETIDTYLDLRDQQPFDSDWSAEAYPQLCIREAVKEFV